jgi:hypothetical protein
MRRRVQRRAALALLPRDRDNTCLSCHHYQAQPKPVSWTAMGPRWQGASRSDGLSTPLRLMVAYGRATARMGRKHRWNR